MEETARPKPELPKRRSWQRLDGETSAHFDLFAAYRDLPKDRRTAERVYKNQPDDVRLSLSRLRDLCATYHWVQRAVAYDDFVHDQEERAERMSRLHSLRRMRVKHREYGSALMGKAMGFLRSGVKVTSIRDAAAIVKLALELEASGHHFDPLEAIVSGDEPEQSTDSTETRRLAIEVFTSGGATMPADDLRNVLMGFYDQKPSMSAILENHSGDNTPPVGLDEPDQGLDETQPQADE